MNTNIQVNTASPHIVLSNKQSSSTKRRQIVSVRNSLDDGSVEGSNNKMDNFKNNQLQKIDETIEALVISDDMEVKETAKVLSVLI